MGENLSGNFCLNSYFHLNLGIFYMPQIYDMGPTALLPHRRKACWEFFRPKNPTASAGFEPANLGTKGQHTTPRPPKPLVSIYLCKYMVVSSTPWPHVTPGKDPVPILQEVVWAPGPVWTGGKSRSHRDSIPDRPGRSQSLYRLSYPPPPHTLTHTHTYIYINIHIVI